jgi:hypothetical protein
MLPTYSAVLRDGQLEWGDAGPPALPPTPVRISVTVLDAPVTAARGVAMAAALAALADAGGPSGFGDDPAAWERDARADRPQPGREE